MAFAQLRFAPAASPVASSRMAARPGGMQVMNAARGQPGARARGVVRPRVQTWRSVACLAFTEGGPDELWSGGASASRRANEEAAGAVPAAAAAGDARARAATCRPHRSLTWCFLSRCERSQLT
mgnify:CR=1 FL=1